VHQFKLAAEEPNKPIALVVDPNKSIPTPVAPKDCKLANKDPAATAPIAACQEAAIEPPVIPSEPKPNKGSIEHPTIPPTSVEPKINFFLIDKLASLTRGVPQLGQLL